MQGFVHVYRGFGDNHHRFCLSLRGAARFAIDVNQAEAFPRMRMHCVHGVFTIVLYLRSFAMEFAQEMDQCAPRLNLRVVSGRKRHPNERVRLAWTFGNHIRVTMRPYRVYE